MSVLFQELHQLLPTTAQEDYFKNGAWQVRLLQLDLELVKKHREEAGAPEVAIEIREPPAPKPHGLLMAGLQSNGTPKPAGVVSAVTKAVMATATTGSDLRDIAVFVSKWKLEPAKTKLMLAKLSPLKRRWVLQNFKLDEGEDEDKTPNVKLEEFVKDAEAKNSWGSMTGTVGLASSLVGVKRPLIAGSAGAAAADSIKRPKVGSPAGSPSKMMASVPKTASPLARLAAQRTGAAAAAAPGDLIKSLLQS